MKCINFIYANRSQTWPTTIYIHCHEHLCACMTLFIMRQCAILIMIHSLHFPLCDSLHVWPLHCMTAVGTVYVCTLCGWGSTILRRFLDKYHLINSHALQSITLEVPRRFCLRNCVAYIVCLVSLLKTEIFVHLWPLTGQIYARVAEVLSPDRRHLIITWSPFT